MMDEFDSKEANEAFIEEFEIELSPILQKLKNWNGDPSKLNDLRTVVKADIDDLKTKLSGRPIDLQKLLDALERSSPKEDSEDGGRALALLIEIWAMKMMESAKR